MRGGNNQKKTILKYILSSMIILSIGYYFLINKRENNKVILNDSLIVNQESSFNQKDLSEEEIKEWASTVLEVMYADVEEMYEFFIEVGYDGVEDLTYITVESDFDTEPLTVFRINTVGELEESGKYLDTLDDDEWIYVSSQFMDIKDIPKRENPKSVEERISSGTKITSREFTELYAEFSQSTYPATNMKDYVEGYAYRDYGEETIEVPTYDNENLKKEEGTVVCVIQTNTKPSDFYYLYNNKNRKAYRVKNGPPEDREEYKELTEFINNKG